MKFVSIDWETYYGPGYTLSSMTTEEYIRDPRFEAIGLAIKPFGEPARWYAQPDVEEGLATVDWDNTCMVSHNVRFDGAITNWCFNRRPARYVCTVDIAQALGLSPKAGGLSLAKLLLWANRVHNLGAQPKGDEVVRAMGMRYRDFTPDQLHAYGEYCRIDAAGTEALLGLYIEKLGFPPAEIKVVDAVARCFIEPLLHLDRAVLAQHLQDTQDRREALLARVGADVSALRSDSRFAQMLRDAGTEPPTKLSPKKVDQYGAPLEVYAFAKTDQEFVALLDHEDEEVQALVACRLGVKSSIEESRTLRLIGIQRRGPLPAPIKYSAAHTHRLGGDDSINMQNLPRGGALRRAIIAPPGHSVVAGDSSQIEARSLAWQAGQWDLVDDFAKGVDVYIKFAIEQVFMKPEISKEERFVGKTSILGLGYGMGGERFQVTLRRGQGKVKYLMALDAAQATVNRYRARYPQIKALWKQAGEGLDAMLRGGEAPFGLCPATGFLPASRGEPPRLMLPGGLMVRYWNLRTVESDKGKQYVYDQPKGKAWVPTRLYGAKAVENQNQGFCRMVGMWQWQNIAARAVRERVFHRTPAVMHVHDELVCVVPTAAAPDMKALMEEEMRRVPQWATGLPAACKVEIGPNYGEAK